MRMLKHEVKKVDKYEYNLKLEEIKKLIDKQDYKGAAEIADSIEWKRVRNVRTLCMVSEIYEANDRLEDAKAILQRAYARSSTSRTILYRLVEIAVKMKEFDEAVEYYGEFINAAPNDNSRYILKYKIYKGRGSSIEDQIAILEEYKEREYTEKWAYELAKLYSKANKAEECIETCDDLVLWFHSGPYVIKALELKQKYAQLTKEQQTIYDRRYEAAIEKEEAVEAAVPQIEKVIAQKMPSSEEEALTQNIIMQTERELAQEVSQHAATVNVTKSMDEDWELPESSSQDISGSGSGYEPEKPDAPGKAKYDTIELQAELARSMRELVSDIKRSPDHDPEKLRSLNIEDVIQEAAGETAAAREERREDFNLGFTPDLELEGKESVNQEKKGSSRKGDMPETDDTAEYAAEDEFLAETEQAAKKESFSEAKSELAVKKGSFAEAETDGETGVSADTEESSEMDAEQEPEFEEEQITGQLSIDDVLMSMGSDEEIDGQEPEEDFDFDSEEDDFSEEQDDIEGTVSEEDQEGPEGFEEEEETEPEVPTGATIDLSKDVDLLKRISLQKGFRKVPVSEKAPVQKFQEPAEKDQVPAQRAQEPIEKAQAPVQRAYQPVQKGQELIAESQKPAQKEQERIQEKQQKEEDKKGGFAGTKPKETVWNVGKPTSREEAYKSVMPKRRDLTRSQRYLFSYFSTVQGMVPQIAEALEEVIEKVRQDKTSRSGNLIITGMEGSGRTSLAVKFAKAVSKEKGEKSARIARIYAEDLNQKDIPSTVAKIAGGFLIIEEAGDLQDETVSQLSKAMEFRTDALVVILEDERKYLKEMMADNPEFAEKFTAELTVPVFTNDELVTFGKIYANDLDYCIDEMATLALYNKISERQSAEQPVTILDVKEIVDAAVKRSERFGLRKLLMIITHKRYDSEDRIILFEKDFK